MPVGPGKYNPLCTMVREETDAQAVVVIVLNGNRGSGFSVQAVAPVPPTALADLLQHIVDDLRKRTEP